MREFNITGNIIPEEHYHVDLTPHLNDLMRLAEKRKYFVINRPRQFGKTTLLDFFAQDLQASEKYTPVSISFERFIHQPDITEASFYSEVAEAMNEELNDGDIDSANVRIEASSVKGRGDFFKRLRGFCQHSPQKIVMIIDEIDAVPETVVIGFLAGLREMYLRRHRKPAPHAVALAGVHDIKNLKARYRDKSQALESASPFNIAVDYALPSFSLENIRQYYMQHTSETGQAFDEKVFTRVHHVTNGHPWLVSVLAKSLVEDIVPDRGQKIVLSHTDEAVQELINARNPNFESLFKNARKPNIFPIVLDLLAGKKREYNIQADSIDLGVTYGVFAAEHRQLIIANRIYTQVLYKHFKEELEGVDIDEIIDRDRFEDASGRLDFRLVLEKFQSFMKSKGGKVVKQKQFKEATAQLLFFSFLDLLVNGKGWTFKEVQSGEGLIDVICCYGRQKEVVELKLWYGSRRYEEGLNQLAQYLESESLDHGYLLVFDRRETGRKSYTFREHSVAGKKIQAWVV